MLAYKVLALAGALAVIPLFLLQAISLRAFCSYCVVTEAIMLSVWVASFWLTAPGQGGEPADGRRRSEARGQRQLRRREAGRLWRPASRASLSV